MNPSFGLSVGNLNHFIGAILGGTGYVRQRNQEFSLKDVPVTELKSQVENTIEVIENTLKKPMTTDYFLTHLVMHLSYHLGQVNYHRRLLS